MTRTTEISWHAGGALITRHATSLPYGWRVRATATKDGYIVRHALGDYMYDPDFQQTLIEQTLLPILERHINDGGV